MKAVRLYEPGDIRVDEVEVPKIKSNEVLIKVMAVGICGSDLPRVLSYGAHVAPLTIGHEFCGIIEKKGSDITKFDVGDKVTVPPLIPCYECEWCKRGAYSLCDSYDYYGSRSDGAMANYVAVQEDNLLYVPENISFEDAATTDPCANAFNALNQGVFTKDDSVCVYGVGPIGLFAVQIAKILGAENIIAVDIWDEKLNMAKSVGATEVINSKLTNPVEAIKNITDNRGVDLVIDTTGAPNAQKNCVLSSAKLGRVVLLGISHQPLNLSEQEVDYIMRGQLHVIGSWNSFTAPFPGSSWTKSIELFDKQGMTAKDIISHRITLEEVPEIFNKIKEGNFFFNKIMIYPWGIK